MIIENTFTVNAPRQDVAEYLLTPEKMMYCVTGVEEVEQVDDSTYKATLQAKVGPIRATFQGNVTFDGSQAPEQITANADGKDRRSGSSVQVELVATLTETEPNVTTVSNRADVAMRGRLGRFGTGVIQSISEEMIQDFASCVQRELTGEAGEESGSAGTSGSLTSTAMRGIFKDSTSRLTGRRNRNEEE